MVRVAFRYGDSRILSRLICLWMGGDAAHCEIAIQQGGEEHFCISSSALDGGVRGKVISLSPGKWRVYEVPGPVLGAYDWLETNDGRPYDHLGLLGFVLRPFRGLRNAWFCSEACADILGYRDPWRFDPALLESVCARVGQRVQ